MVLLALPGGPHYTAVQFAAFAERAIAAPIPSQSKSHEAASYLDMVRPDVIAVQSVAAAKPILEALREPTALLVVDGDNGSAGGHPVMRWDDPTHEPAPGLRPATELHPDTVLIQFTSGSTGRPKGVLITNENLLANQDACADLLARFSGKAVFNPTPQSHAFGGAALLEHVTSGCAVHLANHFLPGEHLERIRRYCCTGITASPNYFKLLLRHGFLKRDSLEGLDAITIGAEASDQAFIASLREALPHVRIHIRYGLSESVGPLTRLDLGPGETLAEPGLVGLPLAGVELAPGLTEPEDGEPREVLVRGAATAVGQVTGRNTWEPLVKQADGGESFLRTGDLGYLDAEGRVHLRGRISSFIKSYGFRINPFEIEGLLQELPEVQTAVVIGVSDPLAGQIVVACLEPAPGADVPDEQELKRYCSSNLSPFKVPQGFEVFSPMPRMPSGKPDRQGLIRQLGSA